MHHGRTDPNSRPTTIPPRRHPKPLHSGICDAREVDLEELGRSSSPASASAQTCTKCRRPPRAPLLELTDRALYSRICDAVRSFPTWIKRGPGWLRAAARREAHWGCG